MAEVIVNVMLGRGLGGLERAFVNVGAALQSVGFEVRNIVSEGAAIANYFPAQANVITLRQSSQWDLRAIIRLNQLHNQHRPAAILSHGARAGALVARALKGRIPHAAMLHSARLKRLDRFDLVISVTQTLGQAAVAVGMAPGRVRHVPNFLLDVTPPPRTITDRPVRLGFLGRLSPEKGADRLIDALLHRRASGGAPTQLWIAGDGLQRAALEKRAAPLGAEVAFVGWQTDPAAFLADIDILIAPSRSEVFGLVILEAWRAGAVVVATPADGPLELIHNGDDGLICAGDPATLAHTLDKVIASRDLRCKLVAGGHARLPEFAITAAGPALAAVMRDLITTRAAPRGP